MTHTIRYFMMLVLMLAFAGPLDAQDDFEESTKAEKWYANRCEKAILRFEGLCRNADHHAQKYCVFPCKDAAPLGYALAIASSDKSELFMFTPNGQDVKAQRIDGSIIPKDVYWENISRLGRNRNSTSDITLRERPLPVRTPNKAQNVFVAVTDGDEPIDNIKSYNQMIFKPHRNGVRLSKQNDIRKTNDEGEEYLKERQYVFNLLQPSVVAKMFRGYNDEEMCPWVVKSSFFNNHTLLQYSRWKDGEPIRKASREVCQLISSFYGGRHIKDSRWVATLEGGERTFYAVQFENTDNEALAALVCVGEHAVLSAWEFLAQLDSSYKEGESIWFVDDDGNFMEHIPEIHCIVDTEEGMELYVRLFGGESVQYYILREIGQVWVELQVDYWVYVWD